MLDKADSSRPERRSALGAPELFRLNVDITALSEVLLSDKGSLAEHGAGYTLYWSGKPSIETRLLGVGVMVRNSIVSRPDRPLGSHHVNAPTTGGQTTPHTLECLRSHCSGRSSCRQRHLPFRSAQTLELLTVKPGKVPLEDMALVTVTTMDASC